MLLSGLDPSHYPTGGPRTFGYGSTWKCIEIQNGKEGNLSTTLLIIGFHNYKDIILSKLSNRTRSKLFWFDGSQEKIWIIQTSY